MTKQVIEAGLNSRTARLKLEGRKKPHYRLISEGLHLGYRRSTVARQAGTWLCRRYLGTGKYEVQTLGSADDFPDMPGVKTILNFDQAQAAAKDWARRRSSEERAEQLAATSPTVRGAVTEYIKVRKARSPRGRDAELRLNHHVLSTPLADMALTSLKEADLARWRAGLQRGGRAAGADAPALANSTVARLLSDLKAALRAAARKGRLPSDVATTITEGLRAPEAPNRARAPQILTDAEVTRLLQAARAQDEDLGDLVLMLATTGCRFDQAARTTVSNLQQELRRSMIPTAFKGSGIKQVMYTPRPMQPGALGRLHMLREGRDGTEPLLTRWHMAQVKGDKAAGKLPQWVRVERRPWRYAGQMTRHWKAALQVAGLPAGLVPYCLRHTSIVRMLRHGVPVRIVAAAHDTSIAMIEKHYSAYIVDATEDMLRNALLPLEPSN